MQKRQRWFAALLMGGIVVIGSSRAITLRQVTAKLNVAKNKYLLFKKDIDGLLSDINVGRVPTTAQLLRLKANVYQRGNKIMNNEIDSIIKQIIQSSESLTREIRQKCRK